VLQTQLASPPPMPPSKIALGFEDDEIRELGDRIAALSPVEARELSEYLRVLGVDGGFQR
jgi:hypothetical protein